MVLIIQLIASFILINYYIFRGFIVSSRVWFSANQFFLGLCFGSVVSESSFESANSFFILKAIVFLCWFLAIVAEDLYHAGYLKKWQLQILQK